MGGDGDLAHGDFGHRESEARGTAGERAPRANSSRKHVSAFEIGTDPRVRVGASTMEGTSGRRDRSIFTEGRRTRPRQTGTNAARESAQLESPEATGVPEVRLDRERAK